MFMMPSTFSSKSRKYFRDKLQNYTYLREKHFISTTQSVIYRSVWTNFSFFFTLLFVDFPRDFVGLIADELFITFLGVVG